MSYGYVEISYLSDIASAIREKNGLTRTYKPSEMAAAIRALSIGGQQSSAGYYSIYDTNAMTVGASAYKRDSYLTAATFTQASTVMPDAFLWCSNLSLVSLPACTSIGNSAFFNCCSLASVSLPVCENVGSSAFSTCYALASISLPACENVGNNAFNGCTVLSVVSLPVCASIGANAFYGCYNLVSLYLASVSVVPALGNDAFGYTPIGGYLNSAGVYGSVYVPASLYDSFVTATNWSLVSSRIVAIGGQQPSSSATPTGPYSIYDTTATYVASSAYRDDPYLVAATFTRAVSVGDLAFAGCDALSDVGLPACTSLGSFVFSGCRSLASASLPVCQYVGYRAFGGCHSLGAIDLPACTHVEDRAFESCVMLSSVSLPAVTSIGYHAFTGCTSLTSITLPSCEHIGAAAFESCNSLMSVYLTGSTVVTMETNPLNAFEGTPMYTSQYTGAYGSIYVPSSLYAQYVVASGWSTIRNRIVSINGQQSSSTATPEVTPATPYSIYDTTTVDIPSKAYYNDTNLTNATFTMATKVNPSAFEGCTALSRVELPACSNRIDNRAFFGCTSLMTVVLTSSDYIPEYGGAVFANTPIENSAYTGAYGSIYVDPARHANFSYASGWSTIISRITPRPVDGIAFEATSHNSSYSIYDTTATYISSFTFTGDQFLTSATFTKVRFIEYNAFYDCGDLSYLSLPECTYIGPTTRVANDFSGFKFAGLTSLYLPKASYVEGFDNCYSLSTISMPSAFDVTGFNGCAISRLSLPKAEFVCGFDDCNNLTAISLPAVRYIQGFYGCQGLTTITLPSAYSLSYAFSNCGSLTTIRLSEATALGTDLVGCYALRDIYMNRADSYDFSVVDVRAGGGYSFLTIHVPSDMVSYLNDYYSNYSSVARFVAI